MSENFLNDYEKNRNKQYKVKKEVIEEEPESIEDETPQEKTLSNTIEIKEPEMLEQIAELDSLIEAKRKKVKVLGILSLLLFIGFIISYIIVVGTIGINLFGAIGSNQNDPFTPFAEGLATTIIAAIPFVLIVGFLLIFFIFFLYNYVGLKSLMKKKDVLMLQLVSGKAVEEKSTNDTLVIWTCIITLMIVGIAIMVKDEVTSLLLYPLVQIIALLSPFIIVVCLGVLLFYIVKHSKDKNKDDSKEE